VRQRQILDVHQLQHRLGRSSCREPEADQCRNGLLPRSTQAKGINGYTV
jgi:hypothetical protein